MPYFADDPEHWHARAKDARSLAKAIADPEAREKMLRVAEAYERMAARADERLNVAAEHGRT